MASGHPAEDHQFVLRLIPSHLPPAQVASGGGDCAICEHHIVGGGRKVGEAPGHPAPLLGVRLLSSSATRDTGGQVAATQISCPLFPNS